ncbi:MAG: MFS transporter, partial [Actinobacteria bacterium]|nr:MFS transporter [Actinomycetota bacterium]
MTQKSPLLVASVAAAGLGMVMYDNTAITVALPAIRDAFHTDTSSLQWMLNGLSLMTGSMLPFSGALGDRFGPKRTFRAGILLFAAAALMGSFSTSIGMLIGFRVLQGFGGALLLPNSTALLNANVTPETRNHTVGLWISISATGLIVGPLGGGLLISHFGWRAALYGHTIIALFGAWRIGKLDDGPRRENSLDFPGILTASFT